MLRITSALFVALLVEACGGEVARRQQQPDAAVLLVDAAAGGDAVAGSSDQRVVDSRPDAARPADSAAGPVVRFISPANGATVDNPVSFEIAAEGVDAVQIFADETWPLAPAWNPAQRTTLLYRFSGTGVPRKLHVTGSAGGLPVARADLTITVRPDPCEHRFFVSRFDAQNKDSTGKLDLTALREGALAAVVQQVQALQTCGAAVTLGGMLSLLYFEGALRVGAFNTRCTENSYYKSTSNCHQVPEALYSYQYGLGAIHTSNFHPCKGGSYTKNMRQRFLQLAAKAGFGTDPKLVTPALAQRFQQVCPGSTPNAVDYYILGAHDTFGVPYNTAGNHLAGFGKFPFFTPDFSVALSFAELLAACSSISGDRKAITIYGGGDSSYGTTAKQDQILAIYSSWAATNCK